MKVKILALSAVLLGLAATSCVSSKKYAELQGQHQELQSKYQDLQNQYGSTREQLISTTAEAKNLTSQLEFANKNNEDLKKGMGHLKNTLDKSLEANNQGSVNIAKLVDEINASNKYIKQLVEAKSKSDSLNIALTNRLTRSLSKEELKDVDVKVLKGVVYISLADNMLFKSGSYEVSDRAMETLSKIAKILGDYKDFDVLVEGNTDNVPISKTNIRNNWDLSALRASSIVQVLQNKFGINPQRMSAAGRGEFNPISDNDSEVGKQRNRRTEIIITPKLDEFMDLIDMAPESND
ncbi:MAG: OmpA family protein [Muribaculaceae bacterium]|nr:OmpA family protein [Muribaculaceae bacterium]